MDDVIGFVGLGRMGEPMASRLLAAGYSLRAWNRSAAARERAEALGAELCDSAHAVITRSRVTMLMLANGDALLEILGLDGVDVVDLTGRTLINMGTIEPALSKAIAARVAAAGGNYVEAPVSGSRGPAERGALVGMVAGAPLAVAVARPLLAPLCRQIFDCGAIPGALSLKLAVNLYLITMVTGLAEAAHFAANQGLDLALFKAVIEAGPMASEVAAGKLGKLVATDMRAEASLRDVLMNAALIGDAAHAARIASPLLDQSRALLGEAVDLGLADLDMIGVTGALEQLTTARRFDDAVARRGQTALHDGSR